MGGLTEAPPAEFDHYEPVHGNVMRQAITRCQDDYHQAGERYRTFEPWEREELLANISGDLKKCPEQIALRMVWHFYFCDADYGTQLAQRAGLDLKKALALEPLPGHPAPHAHADPACDIDASGVAKRRAAVHSNGAAGAKVR
jgi:catalase